MPISRIAISDMILFLLLYIGFKLPFFYLNTKILIKTAESSSLVRNYYDTK